jgi:hypothetical protein
MKKCKRCEIEKHFHQFSKNKKSKDELQSYCKDCNKEYFKKYYVNNKGYLLDKFSNYRNNNKQKRKEYILNNKEKINKTTREYFKNRKKTDLLFKFTCNTRCLISKSFKRGNNQFRKDSKTEYILGCTIQEFRLYIENKFTEGMTWENQGKWHLDHIKPISLATTEEEVIQLNHYTNFQPLWALDNILKRNKY